MTIWIHRGCRQTFRFLPRLVPYATSPSLSARYYVGQTAARVRGRYARRVFRNSERFSAPANATLRAVGRKPNFARPTSRPDFRSATKHIPEPRQSVAAGELGALDAWLTRWTCIRAGFEPFRAHPRRAEFFALPFRYPEQSRFSLSPASPPPCCSRGGHAPRRPQTTSYFGSSRQLA